MNIIASYHKTGGGFFRRIFNRYKQLEPDFCFDFFWDFSLVVGVDSKNVVIIRHPFEIIMSAVRYHQISSEPWLLEKDENGNSYQEKIKSLKNTEDKINFEIENCSGRVINSLINDVNKDKGMFVKLEHFCRTSQRKKIAKIISDFLLIKNDVLFEVIEEQSKIKSNFTTKFSFTWQSNFTKSNYAKFNEVIGLDKVAYLGYINKTY